MSRRVNVLILASLGFMCAGSLQASEQDGTMPKPRSLFSVAPIMTDLLNMPYSSWSQNRHFDRDSPKKVYPIKKGAVAVRNSPKTPLCNENEGSSADATTILMHRNTWPVKQVSKNSRAQKTLQDAFDDDLRDQNTDLKRKLSEAEAYAKVLESRWMSSTADAESYFNTCFTWLSAHELKAYYQAALNHIKDTTHPESAQTKLEALWQQLDMQLSSDSAQVVDKCFEAYLMLTLLTDAIFANARDADIYRAACEFSNTFQSKIEDWYAVTIKEKYTQMEIPKKHFLRRPTGIRSDLGRERSIPVLLYLLRVDPVVLCSSSSFEVNQWQRLQLFIPYLTVPERIALHQHLAIGLELNAEEGANYTTVLPHKQIMNFLKKLGNSIDDLEEKKSMEEHHIIQFNTHLLSPFRGLLGLQVN